MSNSFALEEVKVALTPLARFEEFIQSRGKRVTQQRRIILHQVFSRHEHFDADDLLGQLQAAGERRVSRPTVYRTLAELVDAGLLRKMNLGSRALYEHDYGYPQHDHLYCKQCEKLVEFHSDEIREICEAVGREHNFRVLGHRVIVTGVCPDCARGSRPKRRLDLI